MDFQKREYFLAHTVQCDWNDSNAPRNKDCEYPEAIRHSDQNKYKICRLFQSLLIVECTSLSSSLPCRFLFCRPFISRLFCFISYECPRSCSVKPGFHIPVRCRKTAGGSLLRSSICHAPGTAVERYGNV